MTGDHDTVLARIRDRMAAQPSSIAIRMGKRAITYSELGGQVARLASRIAAADDDNAPVGILLRRSPELVASILATWTVGRTALPLPLAGPAERLNGLLRTAGARALVVDADRMFDTHVNRIDPRDLPGPGWRVAETSRIAYILFTSGSTGTPKGVAMSHAAFSHVSAWAEGELCAFGPPIMLQTSAIVFDVAMVEIVSVLAAGGTVCMVDEDEMLDPARLVLAVRRYGATHIFLPHVVLHGFAREIDRTKPVETLREIWTGGEQMIVTDLLRRALGRYRLRNIYGPTETHIATDLLLPADATLWPDIPGIGRPLPGVRIDLVDPSTGVPSPAVEGELRISGPTVADGYIGEAGPAAHRFLSNTPGAGWRAYLTGDLARRAGDSFEYLGRGDSQVKIRGVVVDIPAIETLLLRVAGVRSAAVVAVEAPSGRELAAFIARDDVEESQSLRWDPRYVEPLRLQLDEASVPSTYVTLPELPIGSTGKIARAELVVPQPGRPPGSGKPIPPTDSLERTILQVFELVLGIAPLGVLDDFFDFGGHSLLAIAAQHSLAERGLLIGVADLFTYRTARVLAASLNGSAPDYAPRRRLRVLRTTDRP